VELGTSSGNIDAIRTAYYWLAFTAPWFSPDERASTLSEVADFAQERGFTDLMAFVHTGNSELAWREGRLADSEDEARRAIQIWTDSKQNLSVVPVIDLGTNQARRGATAEAILTLGGLADSLAQHPETVPGNAIRIAEAHWTHSTIPFDVPLALDELAAEDGDEIDGTTAWSLFWMWKIGLVTDISLLRGSPEGDIAEGAWERAAQRYRDDAAPFQEAIALAHGDRDARLSGLDRLYDMGAFGTAERLRVEMIADGFQDVPRGPSRATRTHPLGLTKRQDEVLSLLQAGRSNREIADELYLSIRTVENHVASVLSRMGLRSREDVLKTQAE
jgi:DNA-binding CsgD family transcriptional regulator